MWVNKIFLAPAPYPNLYRARGAVGWSGNKLGVDAFYRQTMKSQLFLLKIKSGLNLRFECHIYYFQCQTKILKPILSENFNSFSLLYIENTQVQYGNFTSSKSRFYFELM